MNKNFDENTRVKIPTILHLTRLSYEYISFKSVVHQIDSDTNIYKSSFSTALNKINAVNLSNSDIKFIIRDIKNILIAEGSLKIWAENFMINYKREFHLMAIIFI